MATELVERPLTPIEIKQRQCDHLRLLTEIDTCESEIQEHRRNAKDAATEMKRIKSRERQLRQELRDGCVFEVRDRQQKLALDPDMETEDECSARTVREEMSAAGHTPFCDHKFIDSKNCLKCGISFAELKAESLRESQRLNGISATTDEPDPETDPPGRSIEVTCQRCGKTLSELGVNLGGALAHHSACTGPAQWDDPMSHGYGAAQDDPPEHDKPEFRDIFAEMYPMAANVIELRAELSEVLDTAQFEKFLSFPIPPPRSIVFDELAHWSRVSKARSESEIARQRTTPDSNGLYVPNIPPMPKVLKDALGKLAPKGKRGARPLSNPPKKRRSGSTQHSP